MRDQNVDVAAVCGHGRFPVVAAAVTQALRRRRGRAGRRGGERAEKASCGRGDEQSSDLACECTDTGTGHFVLCYSETSRAQVATNVTREQIGVNEVTISDGVTLEQPAPSSPAPDAPAGCSDATVLTGRA